MTDTEKILNLLELNENLPAMVLNEDGNIISSNHKWNETFELPEQGKSFHKIFDKNTGLLVKNSFIDAATFFKVQRRNIQISKNDVIHDLKLLFSPFKIEQKLYYYVLLFNNSFNSPFVIYPSIDDNSIAIKYEAIIKQLKENLPTTLIEKKNFQFSIDSEKESLAIKDKIQFSYTNSSFNNVFNIDNGNKGILSTESIIPSSLISVFQQAENELYLSQCMLIIEKEEYNPSIIQQSDRLILFPIVDNTNKVDSILLVGSFSVSNSKKQDEIIKKDIEHKENKTEIEFGEEAKLIYDINSYDILDANSAAAELYGYNLDVLKSMNVTQLFLPEDMQKLLMPAEENGNYLFNQVKEDGSSIEVNVERKNILWFDKEACEETITLNQPEEEVIKLEEYSEQNISEDNVEPEIEKDESVSEFLSSLFHELLTPVNVILGFVQEIIDSIENPTEEQSESAQIIKDNQQVLLQAMNTAVQYVQLDKNTIKLNIEEFEFNNYLVDLKDSFTNSSDQDNVNVVLNNVEDNIILTHDRSKLLAAISYFIKFAVKLTNLPNIFVSFKVIDNHFYVLLKDNVNGVSEPVSNDMLEIFNTSVLSDKKNYNISPITIRLVKRIADLLSIDIQEYTSVSNEKHIAFITPTILKEKPVVKKEVKIEKHKELIDDTIHEFEDVEPEESEEKSESEIIASENLVDEDYEEIATGMVEEKIVEDIDEEEEIVTEEIATVETIQKEESSELQNLSCLFIDDSVDTQLLFKAQMKDFKLLKVCSNLSEALPLLSKYNFDLIIVDVNLNDTYNGLDALKIIRQFSNYKLTPIFAVTAYSFQGDKEKFINFGFTDYFVKPLFKEQLLKSLETIIQ